MLAQRYGLLPSELLSKGSTFDLWICNSALQHQSEQQAEQNGDFSHYSVEELMAIRGEI